nr:RNA-directed DNA polymerase, eukaryota, reverse transcriptase zinc-binding domain protein [Tanacetum cinerariifolium]
YVVLTGRVVVPTSRVVVHTGRYAVPTGRVVVPTGRVVVPSGSIHLTFQNVVDASMFKGIVLNSYMVLSHMFFADDAVFVGQWSNSNIDTIIYALKCFERASGLKRERLGDGVDTCFWKDTWNGELPFKLTYPRLYALEVDKNISVADKLAQATLAETFRREPRSGIEAVQLAKLEDQLEDVQLVNKRDRWAWSLNGSGEFSVASIRRLLDDIRLPEVSSQTRWIKAVPIKVNIWHRREVESMSHVFFSCYVAKDNFKKVCRWWNLDFAEVSSYDEWLLWISSLRIHVSGDGVLLITSDLILEEVIDRYCFFGERKVSGGG